MTSTRKIIRLWSMPDDVMLLIEHPSGVWYQNQVGGIACSQGELEGVLATLDMSTESKDRIMTIPFDGKGGSLSSSVADLVDDILSSEPSAEFLRVDRTRLLNSCEAWLCVKIGSISIDTKMTSVDYAAEIGGFGNSRGVLTWPNSD